MVDPLVDPLVDPIVSASLLLSLVVGFHLAGLMGASTLYRLSTKSLIFISLLGKLFFLLTDLAQLSVSGWKL